jgi:hypothetical protein
MASEALRIRTGEEPISVRRGPACSETLVPPETSRWTRERPVAGWNLYGVFFGWYASVLAARIDNALITRVYEEVAS